MSDALGVLFGLFAIFVIGITIAAVSEQGWVGLWPIGLVAGLFIVSAAVGILLDLLGRL